MKNIKKLVAAISVVALVALNFANTNAASPTASISWDTVTLLTTGTTSADTVTLVVKKDGTPLTVTTDYTVDSSVNGTITVTAVTPWDFNNSNLDISYITLDGDNWAVVVNNKTAWTAWSNSVTVSAYVLPILSMSISDTSIDFGELVPWVTNTQTTDVTTASNAKDWVTVSVASTWLATWNTGTDKYIWNLARWSATSTTWSDTYQISSSTTNGWTALSSTNVGASQNVLVANNVAKANATTTVSLAATSTTTTEAGNYNDTLTFTVTGTF
jgi:hypothetical protein